MPESAPVPIPVSVPTPSTPSPGFTITLSPGTGDVIRRCLFTVKSALPADTGSLNALERAHRRNLSLTQMWSLLHAIGYTFLTGERHDGDLYLSPDILAGPRDEIRSLLFAFTSGYHGGLTFHPDDSPAGGTWQIHT
jgi:hypothetical protein